MEVDSHVSRAVKTVHFSPDGLRVLSGSDDTSVRNWDLATGACITTLRGHEVSEFPVASFPVYYCDFYFFQGLCASSCVQSSQL